MKLLLAPDPVDPASPPAPQPPAAPATPKVVAKTPIKTPNEIRLEKEVAGLRDEVDGLKGWKDEVNASLESLNVGAPPKPAPVKVKPVIVPTPTPIPTPTPQPPSFLEQVDADIWGSSKAS